MRGLAALAVLALATGLSAGAYSAPRLVPAVWKNCTAVNKRYPHGLGKTGARDHTSGTPVTNFKRSDKLYKLALSYNRGLDRDGDGIACETS